MLIMASEIGSMAAENVADILRGAGDGLDAQLGAATWAADTLTGAGWTTLTARDSGADLSLRDLQQLARVTGRFLVPNALCTTLLAGRWFPLEEEQLAPGLTFPVPAGAGPVLPYAVAGTRVLDAAGESIADLPPVATDDFSAVMALAPVDGTTPVIEQARLDELCAVFAATATGCADAVLDRAVDWVQTRRQFGRALKDFQAIRHHLANMHIAREDAWTAAVAAGEEIDQAPQWAWTAVQRAKAVVETGIQVHGGIGFTWEAGLHHWLRHLLQLESLVDAHGPRNLSTPDGDHLRAPDPL